MKMLRVFSIYWKKYSGVRKSLVFARFLRDLPKLRRYLQDLNSFQSSGGKVDRWSIHLHEDSEFAGDASGHYFWQDLVVAQWVLAQNKKLVADIGSRLDGYVSHVASSQKVFFIDIRPIKKAIPNVEYMKEDILNYKSKKRFEIVTSLHTLEHIGLGRYGDPIDPIGHIKAFSSLAKITLPKGQLVVSFPIDSQTRVEFNGQRMVGYQEPIKWAERNKLTFTNFICLRSDDQLVNCKSISSLAKFSVEPGALGIYFFKKKS